MESAVHLYYSAIEEAREVQQEPTSSGNFRLVEEGDSVFEVSCSQIATFHGATLLRQSVYYFNHQILPDFNITDLSAGSPSSLMPGVIEHQMLD